MDLKTLGKSAVKVPAIGMGTWGIGGNVSSDNTSDAENVQAIRKGIQLGMYLIDTAEVYAGGHSEEVVGEAMKPLSREQVFIVSKVWQNHLHYADVINAAEGSLKRLKTDYLDLYLVHWPNPSVPLRETMRAMEELVERKLTRFIGVSNFDTELMEEARGYLSKNDIVVNQVEYNLLDRSIERDVLPYCIKEHILVMAYSPLARGRLSKDKFLQEIGARYGKTAS